MQSVLSFLTRWKIILTSQDRVMFPKLHVDTRSWSPHFSLTAPQSYLLIRLKMIRPSQASTCTSAGKSALAALLRCGVRKMKEKPHWPGRSRVRAAVETPATIRGATISCQAAAEWAQLGGSECGVATGYSSSDKTFMHLRLLRYVLTWCFFPSYSSLNTVNRILQTLKQRSPTILWVYGFRLAYYVFNALWRRYSADLVQTGMIIVACKKCSTTFLYGGWFNLFQNEWQACAGNGRRAIKNV